MEGGSSAFGGKLSKPPGLTREKGERRAQNFSKYEETDYNSEELTRYIKGRSKSSFREESSKLFHVPEPL